MSDAVGVNPISVNAIDGAVILAGGLGRRLGGLDKTALLVGDRTLLDIAIDAAGDCPIVVVGPARHVPAGVRSTREDPPGGGPAAGVAAGLAALPSPGTGSLIAVLAADLPGIDRRTVERLAAALAGSGAADGAPGPMPDGAVLVDVAGRRQFLIGVWQADRLAAAVAMRPEWDGVPLRTLLRPLAVLEIAGIDRETEDVDTPDDWQRWQS